jgi:hypothetical protein
LCLIENPMLVQSFYVLQVLKNEYDLIFNGFTEITEKLLNLNDIHFSSNGQLWRDSEI